MKFLEYLNSLNSLRRELSFQNIYKSIAEDLRVKIVSPPDGDNVLVISPHPDDDVIGCGGTIIKHRKLGQRVTTLYLHNGNRGNRQRIRDNSLISKRKREVQNAAQILGVEKLIFWGYADGKLTISRPIIEAMKTLILQVKPEIFYLPSLLDDHPDHFMTNKLFLTTYRKLQKEKKDYDIDSTKIFAYEVWTPIYPNRLVDITEVMPQKRQALEQHQTQLRSRPYVEAMMSLNRFRSALNIDGGYAEAFFECSPSLYLELYKKLV